MLKKNIIITLFVLAVSLVYLGIFVCSKTYATSGDNVSGFAWSENVGWLSFNSINCDSDGDGQTDTGNYLQCPTGQSINSYGVDLDGTGQLSGYAWSENIGWLSFNESDLSGCPSGTCKAEIHPAGQLGKSNVDIEGWARALAHGGGWDGWIKFDHGQANEPYIDVGGDWHGWAWGSEVVGWLSFNGADSGAGGNYKVALGGVNHPPTATNLQVAKGDYCSIPSHYFSWTYSDPDGNDESQFQFQIDNNSDFGSPEIDRTQTGAWHDGDSNNQTVIVTVSPGSDQIGYNATYYWRVKVYDDQGADSGWVEGTSFTTEKHRYPFIDFNWSPAEPSQEEDVLFADQSTVYGGASKSSWDWTFADGNPASSSQQNPTIQFNSSGSHDVSLKVTDSDGYFCTGSKTVGARFKLPDWQEILPW